MEATGVRSALACHLWRHHCPPPTPVAAVGGSFGVGLNGRAFPVEPRAAAVGNTVRSELTVEPDTMAAELLHDLLHNSWPGEEVHILRPSDRPEPMPLCRGPAGAASTTSCVMSLLGMSRGVTTLPTRRLPRSLIPTLPNSSHI